MEIRELRIRYAVPEMFHPNDRSRDAIHAVVCNIHTLKSWYDKIKEANYAIAGIDERYREENKYMPLSEGWKEIEIGRA